jgi:hypothetical protein
LDSGTEGGARESDRRAALGLTLRRVDKGHLDARESLQRALRRLLSAARETTPTQSGSQYSVEPSSSL